MANSLTNLLDPREQNRGIVEKIQTSIEQTFPIEAGGKRVEVSNIIIEDNLRNTDFPKQKEVKLARKSWTIPVYGTITVTDLETGRVISTREKAKLGEVPKVTNRLSTIIDGNEYQVSNQFRRKSGVYARQRNNGTLQSEFNLEVGRNFSLELDPEKQVFIFMLRGATRQFKLYNLLNTLGVTDAQIAEAWGTKLMEKNRAAGLSAEVSELTDIYRKLFSRQPVPEDFMQLRQELKEYFQKTKMSGEVNALTLGEPFDSADGPAILRASRRLLRISKGEEEQDKRDSLLYKTLLTQDQQLEEFFRAEMPAIKTKIQNNLVRRDEARDIVPANLFTKPVKRFFTTADLASTPPQTNPVAMIANARKTTPMGQGGVQSQHAITMEVRDVDDSHAGFIDPLSTPEGGKVGVNLGLSSNVINTRDGLKTPVIYPDGRRAYKSPKEIYDATVGYPDSFRLKNNKVVPISSEVEARRNFKPLQVPATEVDFYMLNAGSLFDYHSNLIPFLPSTQGNRGSTAGRMITQALPLDKADTPTAVSRVGLDSRPGYETYQDVLGKFLLPSLADETGDDQSSGQVVAITPDYIKVKLDSGEQVDIGLYNEFPLNEDGFLNTTPVVKVGDKVKGDQILAKSNYTDDSGRLSLGANLVVAYLPYKGNSFEDGATMTESAAKKLSHTTIHKETIYHTPKNSTFNIRKFKAHFPGVISQDNLKKLDDEGIIQVGQSVDPGDVLGAYLVTRQADALDQGLKRLNKSLVSPFAKQVLTWDSEDPGVITDVRRNGKFIDIFVKAIHPFKEGDKISGFYGDKHIVGKIIPDHEAPHRPDGTPVQIMVNPAGVPGRMNVGQMMDAAAGKIAQVTGKPYEITNFDPDNENQAKKMLDDMKALGIEPDEQLIDGKTGKPLKNKVYVGVRPYLKLRHIVDKKLSGHAGGVYDIDEQPGGKAQKIGTLESYAYLAHGAKTLLNEAGIKGQKNEEFFRNLERNLPPGVPKESFVREKLFDYMRATGVDVEKHGNKLRLTALTDKKIEDLSAGELKDPGRMLIGKNLTSKKGGLFDQELLGGQQGSKYGHITLPKRIVNPVMEDGVKTVLGITNVEYSNLLDNMPELIDRLDKVNVAEELQKAQEELKTAPASKINKLNSRVRVLQALDREQLTPLDQYTINKVLVIPPKMRPIVPLPSGDIAPSDINEHYRSVGLSAKTMQEALEEDLLDNDDVTRYTRRLYDSVSNLQGLTEPSYQQKKFRGALAEYKDTKRGLLFGKAWAKRQDMSGRSTISFDSELGLDEAGIPYDMAKEIFHKFVMKDLVSKGYAATKALEHIKNETPVFKNALESVMREKPVILNRAPALHKHSTQAFQPKLTFGKDIRLNPLITSGFNVDMDGDFQINSVIFWAPKTYINPKNGEIVKNRALLSSGLRKKLDDGLKYTYISDSQITNKLNTMFQNLYLGYTRNGAFYTCNLEDFPHLEEMYGEKDNVKFHKVQPGIKVFAYNDAVKKLELAEVSGWSIHQDKPVWTVDLANGNQIISDDDPRAVYGIIPSLGWMPTRRRPADAVGMFVPVAQRLNSAKFSKRAPRTSVVSTLRMPKRVGKTLNTQVELTSNFGYALGALIGDGWVSDGKQHTKLSGLCFANVCDEVVKHYKKGITPLFKETPKFTTTQGKTSLGFSLKHTIFDNQDIGPIIETQIGRHAANKHLPPQWFSSPDEFKFGLLSGLMDTDGSITVSRVKSKAQLKISYSSNSLRLLQEIKSMVNMLGIGAKIRFGRVSTAGNDNWELFFNTVDFVKIKDKLTIQHPEKIAALNTEEAWADETAPSYTRQDQIPISEEICKQFLAKMDKSRDASKEEKSLFTMLYKAKKEGSISRATIDRVIDRVALGDLPFDWLTLYNNKDVTWTRVESVENTGKVETGYDLTVPLYETFMTVDGIIVSNTMSVNVPISKDADEEARGLFPSRILFRHGDNSLVPSLSQDYAYGVVKASALGKETNLTFTNIDQAKKAELDITDKFTLNGQKMTIGQYELNKVLPKEYQDYTRVFTGGSLKLFLNKISREQPSEVFRDVITHYKDIGALNAYYHGTSLSLTDLVVDRSYRDDLLKKYVPNIKKLKSEDERVVAYGELINQIRKAETEKFTNSGNRLFDLVEGGALSKSKGGNVSQVMSMPGMVADTSGKTIPIPIFKSYSEGLNTAGYFNTLPGVRKGVVDKSINTQESGALNKQLLSVTRSTLIVEADCGTAEGIKFPVGDKHVYGRTAAETILGVVERNQLIDHEVVNLAKENKVDVLHARSPLKCKSSEGICAYCYGIMPDGKLPSVGINVGILEGQAVSERSTQLVLKNFHSGGAVGVGTDSSKSFPRLEQLLKFPENISAKATLSEVSGRVTSLEPNEIGGWEIKVGNKMHIAGPGRKPLVSLNTQVQKGERLTDGIIKPQELLNTTDVYTTQSHLVDELNAVYEDNFNKKTFETVVRSITDTAEVTLVPSDLSLELVRGDSIKLSKVEALNRERQSLGLELIGFKPYLKSIATQNVDSDDFMTRITTNRVKDGVMKSAARRMWSNIAGRDPIPAYIYGKDFGNPDKKGGDGFY